MKMERWTTQKSAGTRLGIKSIYWGVHFNGGTPSYHPNVIGSFPWNQPSSELGVAPWPWKPLNSPWPFVYPWPVAGRRRRRGALWPRQLGYKTIIFFQAFFMGNLGTNWDKLCWEELSLGKLPADLGIIVKKVSNSCFLLFHMLCALVEEVIGIR